MSEERLTGGCQCGAVRYALHASIGNPCICHCRMCQKAFGSYFAPLGGVPRDKFELTRGEIATFMSSDAAERGFCRDCGTPLTFRYLSEPEINVSMGSLDDPSSVRPVLQVGTETRVPWFAELASLPAASTDESTAPDRLQAICNGNHQHPDHDTADWHVPGQRG
ncbi:GFA family protein [Faunimonas pinastri]|nr:GFA family protein [Faunimonas pinastri]